MKLKLLIFFAVSLCLVACAVSDDPSEGGIIDGISGLFTGTYDERQNEREDNLAAIREARENAQQEQTTLKGTRTATEAEVVALKAEVNTLSLTNRSLSERIANIEATTDEMIAQKNLLNERVQSIRRDIDNVKSASTLYSKELALYQAEKKKLEAELKKLAADITLLEP